jgi:actin related protein 2/3 complex, subunit 1A/1B
MTTLPLTTLTWTSEESIVAAGHDCQPFVFTGNQGGWELVGTLDDPNSNKTSGRSGFGGAPSPVGRLQSSAFNTFRNADSRGISSNPDETSGGSELFTVHQNTITNIRPYDGVPGAVSRVSTSGVDGKLVVWDVSAVTPVSVHALAGKMGGMNLR